MSLVAYDSSDEGSENEENEESVTTTASANTNDKATEKSIVRANLKLSLPTPKIPSNTKDEENEEQSVTGDFKHFLDALPKPKILDSAENVEEDSDIPPRKETGIQTTKSAKRQTVKITVPSLSEFKDLEDEEIEKKPNKTIQPTERGCGLFAVLIPPKKETTKSNKILVPQSVKNATTKMNIQQTKKSSTNQTNSSKTNVTINKSHTDLSSDEEENTEIDFFGLTSKKDTLEDNSVSELLESELSPSDLTADSSDNSLNDQPSNSSKTLTSNVMNLPKEEILLKNKADVGPKLPVPEQEYNVDTEGNVAFDEKAIEYLCGRRGIKRKDKEIDEANIIEINGEDIKPDEREWLIKALTEEPVHRPISMQSCGISSQSKKKHQITYLAHQAKAMELELKNQWSQNRMARKQTKSKYGF